MSQRLLYVPKNAREVVCYVDDYGNSIIDCYVGRRLVGYRMRNKDGGLESEYGVRNGRMDGYARQWNELGVLIYRRYLVDGKQHGIARQWNNDGVLVAMYRMNQGTGHDVWCGDDGELWEEYPYKQGRLHGFERWWNEDQRTIYIERHHHEGQQHGIEREWEPAKRRLRKGFPKYFVCGEQVNKRAYLKAAKEDETLPPLRQEDDDPHRELPPAYFASREAVRKELGKQAQSNKRKPNRAKKAGRKRK